MKLILLLAVLCAAGLFFYFYSTTRCNMYARPCIRTLQEIKDLFPTTKAELIEQVKKAMANTESQLQCIYDVKSENRTFDNTMRALDITIQQLQITTAVVQVFSIMSPNDELRNSALEQLCLLQAFTIDQITHNYRLYTACSEYVEKLKASKNAQQEKLTQQEQYFVDELMHEFHRGGLHKTPEKQAEIRKLKKEISDLEVTFDKNIAASNRFIEVTKDELKGLPESFIENLPKTEKGLYKLVTDYPTFFAVIEKCSVHSTRKAIYKEFMQRGYPENESVLKDLIKLRDKYAQLLDFPSYAAFDIDNQMAKTTDTVKKFLDSVLPRAQTKAFAEFDALKKNLPEGVTLTSDGKMRIEDSKYVHDYYKMKFLDIDEALISEYFPLEHTLDRLLHIYEEFFGLAFKKIDGPQLWHDSLQFLAVYKKGVYVGTVILDLFPRPFKYSHFAELTIVPSVKTKSCLYPSVVMVIGNFPQPEKDKPSLLKRKDVITFFHEFGHAIHALMGATELATLSGVRTKEDFVEMPSQMLEEWMWDEHILKMVSSHYQTKKPLSDELIARIKALKVFETGDMICRQVCYALVSQNLFSAGAEKNPYDIWRSFDIKTRPYYTFDPDDHGYCSFVHLTGYGAKYYGYLWSKVFALDLFDKIKKEGLLNPSIGEQYVNKVIGKGGSQDPMILLKDFLGREPLTDAFFKDLGI